MGSIWCTGAIVVRLSMFYSHYTVHFEAGPDDGCRYSFYCCAILDESFVDHYVNTSDRIGHLIVVVPIIIVVFPILVIAVMVTTVVQSPSVVVSVTVIVTTLPIW